MPSRGAYPCSHQVKYRSWRTLYLTRNTTVPVFQVGLVACPWAGVADNNDEADGTTVNQMAHNSMPHPKKFHKNQNEHSGTGLMQRLCDFMPLPCSQRLAIIFRARSEADAHAIELQEEAGTNWFKRTFTQPFRSHVVKVCVYQSLGQPPHQ